MTDPRDVLESNGQIKILHFSLFEPWGPRRLEKVLEGGKIVDKEVGGHATCFFKITGGGVIHYYTINIALEDAKALNGTDTIVEYVLKPANLRQATVLDTVRIAP